jgi:hypothetical protein
VLWWTTSAAQELFGSKDSVGRIHVFGCSRGISWLLALMKSTGWSLIMFGIGEKTQEPVGV